MTVFYIDLLYIIFQHVLAILKSHYQAMYNTWCDNLIPGIVAACRWGAE